jgi:uncharacterized membrane protein
MDLLIVVTAMACAMVGGVFFTFSSFVMQGLAHASHPHGMRAMQGINVTALTPVFMTALFGTAVACVVVAVLAVVNWQAGSIYLITGSVAYVIGSIVVTIAGNVPLNNALMAADPQTAAGTAVWRTYLRTWTAWNHVRTVACLVAAGLLIAGVLTRA